MSDPMTNAEVEDVLSSIRRLVSDDKPEESAPEPSETPDRLVLTPSLRVQDEEEDDHPTETDAHEEAFDDDAEDMPDPDPTALTEFITESRDLSEEHVEPEHEDDDGVESMKATSFDAGPETFLSYVQRGESFHFNPSPHAEDAPNEDAEDNDQQVEAANEDALQTDVPDRVVEGDTQASEYVGENATEQAEDPAPEMLSDAGQEQTDSTQSGAEAAPSLSDKIAALETLVAGRTDEWEPDDTGTDAYAGTEAPTLAWEDAETADAPPFSHFVHTPSEPDEDMVEQAPVGAAAPEPDAHDVFDEVEADENVLDEEALRDLVADIVRQELQGALGERITRNVRKLVRREIHRALSAQELE